MAASEEEDSDENMTDDNHNILENSSSSMNDVLCSFLQEIGAVPNYEGRVSAVVSVWNRLCNLHLPTSDDDNTLYLSFVSLLEHTAHMVLQAGWSRSPEQTRRSLTAAVGQCGALSVPESLVGCRLGFLLGQLSALAALCDSPWQHHTLCLLLRRQTVTDRQVVEFCCEEGPLVLWQRVQVLCDSKCDDLALTLVSQCNSCLETSQCFRALCSDSMRHQLNDLELVLMFRCKQKQQLISKLGAMQDEQGALLLKRLTSLPEEQRCWRSCYKLAHLACDVFLPRALTATTSPYIADLASSWMSLQQKDRVSLEQLELKVRRLLAFRALYNSCPAHLSQLATLIADNYGDSARALSIELCVLALSRLTNRLRQCGDGAWRPSADRTDSDGHVTRSLLSSGFLCLASVTRSVWLVCRECLLSAFSLMPSAKLIDRLFPADSARGDEGSEDERFAACSDSLVRQLRGESCEADYDVLGGPCVEAVQRLGVPAHLCSDLLVVLSASRWKRLSFAARGDSAALQSLCWSYLRDPSSVAGVATDLKHARPPQHLLTPAPPEADDQFAGIEKGYERYLHGGRRSRVNSAGAAVKSRSLLRKRSGRGSRSSTNSDTASSPDNTNASCSSNKRGARNNRVKLRVANRTPSEQSTSADSVKSVCAMQGKRVTSSGCRVDPLREATRDVSASVWADKLKLLKDVMARRSSVPKTIAPNSPVNPSCSSSIASSPSVSPSPVSCREPSKCISCVSSSSPVPSSSSPSFSSAVCTDPASSSTNDLPASTCSSSGLLTSVCDALTVVRRSLCDRTPYKCSPSSSSLPFTSCSLSPGKSDVAVSYKREDTTVSWSTAVANKNGLCVDRLLSRLPKCMSVRQVPPEPPHHLVYPVHVTGGGTSQSVTSMLSATSVVTAPPAVSSRSAQTNVSHSRPPVSASRNKRPRTSVDNGQASVESPSLSQRSSISVQEVLRRVRQESSAPVSTAPRLTQLLNTPVTDTATSSASPDRASTTILNQLLETGASSEAAVPPSALSQLLDTPASAGGQEETITLYRSQDTVSVPHVLPPRPPHLPEVKQVVIPAVLQQQQQQQMSSLLPQASDGQPPVSPSSVSPNTPQQQQQPQGVRCGSGDSPQVGSQLSQILSRPLDSSRHMKSSRQLASLLTSGVTSSRRVSAPSCVSAASQTSSDISASDEGLVGRIADYLMRSSGVTTASTATTTTTTAVTVGSGCVASSSSTCTVMTPARDTNTASQQLLMTTRPVVSQSVAMLTSRPAAVSSAASQSVTVVTSRPSVTTCSATVVSASQPVLHAGQVLVLNNQQKVLPQNIMLHGQQYTLVTRNSQMIYLPSRLMQVQPQQQQVAKSVRAASSSSDNGATGGSVAGFSHQCQPQQQQQSVSSGGVVSSTTLEQLREFESVLEAVSTRGATPVGSNSAGGAELDNLVGVELLSMTRTNSVTTSTATTSTSVSHLDVKVSSGCSPAANSTVVTSTAVSASSSASPRVRHVRHASTSISQPLTGATAAISSHKLSTQRVTGASLPVHSPTAFKTKPLMSGSLVKTSPVKQELEDDETRQRIAAILQQYQQDLACNPTPTPAPRNRKNPPVYTSRGGGGGAGSTTVSGSSTTATLDSVKNKKKCSPIKRNESTGGETSGSVSESASPAGNDVSPSLERSGSDTSVSTQTVAPQAASATNQPFRTLRVVRLVTPPSHQLPPSVPTATNTSTTPTTTVLESGDSLLPPFHTLAPSESAPGTPPSGWPCAVKQPLEEQLFPGLMKEEPVDDLASPPAALSSDSPAPTTAAVSGSVKLEDSSPLPVPPNGETSTDNVAEDVHIQQASFFTEQLQSCLSTGRQLSPQQHRLSAELPASHQFLLDAGPGSDSLASAGSEGSGPPTPLLSQSSVHVITGVVSATTGVMADQSSAEPPTDIDPLIYHVRVDCPGPDSWPPCCDGSVCLLDRLGAMCFQLQSSAGKQEKTVDRRAALSEKRKKAGMCTSSCDSGLDLTTVSAVSGDFPTSRPRRKRARISALRSYRHRPRRCVYSSSDQEDGEDTYSLLRRKRSCKPRAESKVDFSDEERMDIQTSSNFTCSSHQQTTSTSPAPLTPHHQRQGGARRQTGASRPRRRHNGTFCTNPYCYCKNKRRQR